MPNAFLCICNPKKVWDFRAFFAVPRTSGYWVFPRSVFDAATIGDRLFLRVTASDPYPGIYGAFTVTAKRTGLVPQDHWLPGAHPEGLQYIVDFAVDRLSLSRRVTPEDMKLAGIGAGSRLIQVPQTRATQIAASEAVIVEALVATRVP